MQSSSITVTAVAFVWHFSRSMYRWRTYTPIRRQIKKVLTLRVWNLRMLLDHDDRTFQSTDIIERTIRDYIIDVVALGKIRVADKYRVFRKTVPVIPFLETNIRRHRIHVGYWFCYPHNARVQRLVSVYVLWIPFYKSTIESYREQTTQANLFCSVTSKLG